MTCNSDVSVTQCLLIVSGVIPFVVPGICTCTCSTGNVPYTYLYIYIIICILFILVGGDNEQIRLLSEQLRLGRG